MVNTVVDVLVKTVRPAAMGFVPAASKVIRTMTRRCLRDPIVPGQSS